jgi:hypothetical protein
VRVISLLRSAVAGPRQWPNGALVILTLIIGVVTMHSMSGSPTSHHAPHDASVVAPHDASAVGGMSVSETRDGQVGAGVADPAGSAGECSDGCGEHEAAMAMCLMILVALLALVVPAGRLLWRVLPAWSTPSLRLAVDVRADAAPSLHELCISRT